MKSSLFPPFFILTMILLSHGSLAAAVLINDVIVNPQELSLYSSGPDIFVSLNATNNTSISFVNITLILNSTYNSTTPGSLPLGVPMSFVNGTTSGGDVVKGLWQLGNCFGSNPCSSRGDYPTNWSFYINVSNNLSSVNSTGILGFTVQNSSPKIQGYIQHKLYVFNATNSSLVPINIGISAVKSYLSVAPVNLTIENSSHVVALNNTAVSGTPPFTGGIWVGSEIIFNMTDVKPVLRSSYNITVSFSDRYGNKVKQAVQEIRFIEPPGALDLTSITTNSTNHSSINSSLTTNVSFDLKFGVNIPFENISVAKYSYNPESVNFSSSPLNKYIDILTSQNVTNLIEWVVVKLYYTDQELVSNGISDETELAFYIFNESTSQWEKVAGSGTNAAGNYVYMNTTHFSTYGIFVEPSTETQTSSQSSGSSGGGGGGTAHPAQIKNTSENETREPLPEAADVSQKRQDGANTTIPAKADEKQTFQERLEAEVDPMAYLIYVTGAVLLLIGIPLVYRYFKRPSLMR